MSKFTDTLIKCSPELGTEEINRMDAFYRALVHANDEMNLTAIVEPEEAAEKHFIDSISPADLIPAKAKVIDVGTGGGFPGIPLKIYRPDISLTLLESVKKKTDFLSKTTYDLHIEAEVYCERAEVFAKGAFRESYDVCVSRAVASLAMLAELCLPLVRIGGLFLAYKADYREELEQAANALFILGGELSEVYTGAQNNRHAVLAFKKIKETSEKYPRRYARILKNTL